MGTHDFWHRNKYQIIGASLGILFHSLLLLVVMNGKGIIGIFLVFFDFPIYIIFYVLEKFLSIKLGSEMFEVLFGVGGTLMYAFLGWKAQPFLARHLELFPHSIEDPNSKPIQNDNQDEENPK